ncbi:MAG: ATP-dependent helicase, partial [Bifidobacteriaceae bacterium]|nr:ATP-dependent helicase [Bifidobacteriaceae bacterium]
MSARYSPGALARALDGIVLTDEQAAVVGAPLASRLVVAGAGSGKTFVMALRVAYLVANQQVPSGSILGLTFTRKAAGELNQRIRSMLAKLRARLGVGGDDALAPSVATYDAYASQLVRSYGLRVGADPDAQILSQAQRWQLASQVVEGWAGVDGLDVSADQLVGLLLVLADQCADNEVSPRLLAGYLARVVDRLGRVGPGVNPETGRLKRALPDGLKAAMAALDKRRAAAALISQYRQAKAEAGLMDFSDQAAWARRLTRDGASAPAVMAERARFEAVVLDEFQDTSSSQIEFLAALFGSTPVMAVGDPNQSIYGWRGASADALSAFLDRFQPLAEDRRPPSSAAARPPSPATGRGPERERILHLSVARRNSQAILAVANQLAKPLRLRSQVRAPELRPLPEAGLGHVEAAYLANQADEAAAVAAYLAKHWAPTLDQASPLTAAVLVRARRQLDPMIEALEAAGLDFQVIGRGGLLRTPEVQDIVAALAASQDLTRGDAFIRLATSPRFAVGIKDLDALARLARPARAGELGGQPPWLDGSDRGTRAGDGDGDRGGGIGGEPGRPPEPPPDG